MKTSFKISANYWNNLNDKEKEFMKHNACQFGVQVCKRIISLAKNLDWAEIINGSLFHKESRALQGLSVNCWMIYDKDSNKIAKIEKCSGWGITERIYRYEKGKGFFECWNNSFSANPPKDVMNQQILSVIGF